MSRKYTAQEIRTAVQKSICEDNIAEMLLQYADELEREKPYEYAIRTHDGTIFFKSSDMADVRKEVDYYNADGPTICELVRREVGEWEEVKER